MAVDKVMLRKAICDGAFGNVVNGAPQGQPPMARAVVTPEVLAAVAGMTDDIINATLTLYVSNKNAQLDKQIAAETKRLADLQAQKIAPVVETK